MTWAPVAKSAQSWGRVSTSSSPSWGKVSTTSVSWTQVPSYSITYTIWDGGATTWDAGDTKWDPTQGSVETWRRAQGIAYTYTLWDNGATTWDNDNTFWDFVGSATPGESWTKVPT